MRQAPCPQDQACADRFGFEPKTDPESELESEAIIPEPADYRFLQLIGLEAWQRLPSAVQRRFSKTLPAGTSVVYQGQVSKTRLNFPGRCLAQLTRLLGSPLPRDNGATGSAIVVVTQNQKTAAQNWVRTYTRPSGSMQTITSEKRFQGPTGLEEYVGAGIGMTLNVSEQDGALIFHSDRYFFEAGTMRFWLPRVLAPGQMMIIHRDEGDGQFCFELKLEHRFFGFLFHQIAHFADATPS